MDSMDSSMRASDFEVSAVRLAAFTPILADFKPPAILAAVLGKFGKRFEGNLQVLPLPAELPPEFPRIQLASKDGCWKFTAAPAQINTGWERRDQGEPVTLAGIIGDCLGPLEQHIRENDIRIGRLGMVMMRFCRAATPARLLIERFCSESVRDQKSPEAPLRNSTNFEIHNHKRYALPGNLTVNSWVRCRTGLVSKEEVSAVTVEQDINTPAEELENRTFDLQGVRSFFETGTTELEDTLRKYFP